MFFNLFCVVSPNIITHPAATSAAAPFSGVFMCSINGHGYQNITWFRQSDTLPTKCKVFETISHGVITSTLIIPNVTETDVGKYYCQVWTNNRGTRSKAAVLYYSGKHAFNTWLSNFLRYTQESIHSYVSKF